MIDLSRFKSKSALEDDEERGGGDSETQPRVFDFSVRPSDAAAYERALRKIRVCRTARSEFLNKIMTIRRAFRTDARVCRRLGICLRTLYHWRNWQFAPNGKADWEKVDEVYSEACHMLAKKRVADEKRRKRKSTTMTDE